MVATKAALVRVITAPQGLDAPGGTVSQSSTTLAHGPINGADTLTIELVQPADHPTVVRIVWPARTSIIQPSRFNQVAAEITRLIAAAATAYTQIKAQRLIQ
jgi:hypothetical protein